MQLTPERLNLEYIQWTLENLGDRNKDDLRFSQYIAAKYDHEVHSYLDDPFYYESAAKAYDTLCESLRLSNIQNTL